jgi:hypothetical protein
MRENYFLKSSHTCQDKALEKNKGSTRSDLQTVGFWVLKNARSIAETLTSAMSSVAVEEGVSVDSPWLRLSPTTK